MNENKPNGRRIRRGITPACIPGPATVRLAAVLLVLAVALTGCSVMLTPVPEGAPVPSTTPAAATPEDAIAHFLAGLAQADMDQVLAASAVDEMSTRHDFTGALERLGVLLPVEALAPSSHPFFTDANQARLTAQLTTQVKLLAYALLTDGTVNGPQPLPLDPAQAADLASILDPARLAALDLLRADTPRADLMESEIYQQQAAARAAIYGADESTERIALVAFDGRTYALGFSLLRYGLHWKISDMSSPLAGLGAFDGTVPATEDDFAAMIEQE